VSKLPVLAGLVLVMGILAAPSTCGGLCQTTAAAEGITVVESKASHSFAQQVTFTLQAASDVEITKVYLFFRATGEERTEAAAVAIEPGLEIRARHVHELRRAPLPPFATVTFWWRIENSAGTSVTTETQQFQYTDNRFHWGQLSANGLTVHWTEGNGDPIFGQAALDIVQASVEEINAELRTPVPEAVHVYIYDTQPNLDGAMVLTGREWATGQAHPELGVAVVAIPFEAGYTSRMERYIPHEITHLLLYQAVTPPSYRYIPEWLDEGLATTHERLPTPEYAIAIEEAHAQGQLLPLEDLCVPFSPDPHTAFLAYAQSSSVVQFIRERYGAQGIRALLAAYADGASCGGGVQGALNVSLNGLETAWRASLEPQAPWRALVDRVGVWVGLWLLSLLVAVPMIGRLRRRR
jgi:hypothetical protein